MLAIRLAAFFVVTIPGLMVFFGFGRFLFFVIEVLLLALFLLNLPRLNFSSEQKLSSTRAARMALFWGSSYMVLYAIGVFRGALYGTDSVVAGTFNALNCLLLALATGILYMSTSRRSQSPLQYFQVVMNALAYYCLLNLVGWMLGLENPTADSNPTVSDGNFLLSLMGFDINRVFFPFALGVNTFGTIAGVTATHGVFHMLDQRRNGRSPSIKAFLLHILVPAVCILLSDSRGAGLFVLLAMLFASMQGRAIALVAIGLFVIFIYQLFAAEALTGLSLGVGDRSTSATGILSGRELIWAPVIVELSSPKLIHLVGFGLYGQVASGVSIGYSSIFAGWNADENMISVHNGLLQMVLDIGYVGAVSFFLFFYFSLAALKEYSVFSPSEKHATKAVACAAIYLLLQGLTEISLNASNPQLFYVLIALVVCFFKLNRSPIGK